MLNHHHTERFHFFGNKEVTSLYFTMALVRFAIGLVNIFVPVYLWELGYPIWQILLYFFLEAIYFVVLATLSPVLLKRMSDKSMLLLSVPFFVLYFVGLSFLSYHPMLFFFLPILSVCKSILFNTGYHLDFSGASDKKDLGKEIGTRFMIGSLAALASPFLGGLLIGAFGFQHAFFLSAAILLIAIIPLLFFPKRAVSKKLSAKELWKSVLDKRVHPYTISNFGYANDLIIGAICWQLFMFLIIGSIEAFGAIISLGLLFSAIVTFLAGQQTDNGNRKKVLAITDFFTTIAWGIRLLASTVLGAALGQVAMDISRSSLMVSWTSIFYRLAKSAKNPTIFILGREIVINLSRAIFIPVLMLLSVLVSPVQFFRISFLLAIPMVLLFLVANKQKMDVFRTK